MRDVDIASGVDDELLGTTALGRACNANRSTSGGGGIGRMFARANATCPPTVYRSYGGECNNVRRASSGAAFTPLARLAPAAYADAVALPRESRAGGHLPNERRISVDVFRGPQESHPLVTQLAAYWLYVIAGDIARPAPNQLIVNGKFSRPRASRERLDLQANRLRFLVVRPTFGMSTATRFVSRPQTPPTTRAPSRAFRTRARCPPRLAAVASAK